MKECKKEFSYCARLGKIKYLFFETAAKAAVFLLECFLRRSAKVWYNYYSSSERGYRWFSLT